jgi:hypothetical protein
MPHILAIVDVFAYSLSRVWKIAGILALDFPPGHRHTIIALKNHTGITCVIFCIVLNSGGGAPRTVSAGLSRVVTCMRNVSVRHKQCMNQFLKQHTLTSR